MISQAQEYALRAVIWLADHRDGPVGASRIAQETDVPATYLSKVLQALAEKGILTSRRGAGGGFVLDHDPAGLSVLAVLEAVDPLKRINSCPLKLKSHGKTLCPMHAKLNEAISLVEKVFADATIKELMSQPGRPLPLVDGPIEPK